MTEKISYEELEAKLNFERTRVDQLETNLKQVLHDLDLSQREHAGERDALTAVRAKRQVAEQERDQLSADLATSQREHQATIDTIYATRKELTAILGIDGKVPGTTRDLLASVGKLRADLEQARKERDAALRAAASHDRDAQDAELRWSCCAAIANSERDAALARVAELKEKALTAVRRAGAAQTERDVLRAGVQAEAKRLREVGWRSSREAADRLEALLSTPAATREAVCGSERPSGLPCDLKPRHQGDHSARIEESETPITWPREEWDRGPPAEAGAPREQPEHQRCGKCTNCKGGGGWTVCPNSRKVVPPRAATQVLKRCGCCEE
jgi:hypothetical protein